MSLFCVWSNCRYLEPWSGVITGDPFFIVILDRVTAKIQRQTTFRLGTPRASSSGCSAPLLLSPSSLHLLWARYTHTHTHTHTHTNTANTSTCMYTHMFGMGTQMQTGNTGVSGAKDGLIQQCWRWRQSAPCPAFGAPCPPPPQTPPDFPKEA